MESAPGKGEGGATAFQLPLLCAIQIRYAASTLHCTWMPAQDVEIWYVVWDVLLIDGAAVNEQPLLERKKLLRKAVRDAPPEGGCGRRLH